MHKNTIVQYTYCCLAAGQIERDELRCCGTADAHKLLVTETERLMTGLVVEAMERPIAHNQRAGSR